MDTLPIFSCAQRIVAAIAVAFAVAIAPGVAGADPVSSDVMANWLILSSARSNLEGDAYVPLPVIQNGVAATLATSSPGLPQVGIAPAQGGKTGMWTFRVRAESDKSANGGRGDAILQWTVPESGAWALRLTVRNEGGSVTGGDGGKVLATRLPRNENIDTSWIFAMEIPASAPGGAAAAKPVRAGEGGRVRLEAGDRVNIRFSANQDGYGDCFVGRLEFDRSTDPVAVRDARVILSRGYEGCLAIPPQTAKAKGAPLRAGLFWLGVDGRWANSPFAEEAIRGNNPGVKSRHRAHPDYHPQHSRFFRRPR
jgi:hypothetical protein